MIVLKHKDQEDRVFMPDGETGQILEWEAKGYVRWHPTAVSPEIETASEPTAQETEPTVRVDWTKCKGVSTEIAAALYYMGFNSKDDLLTYFMQNGISALTDIPGIGMKRARDIIAFAQAG